MAREKEKIQREWDAALNELNAAISTAERATGTKTVTERMVQDVDAAYDAWKELLEEAVAKIGAWKRETDVKRLEWMKFVNTQNTKTNKNFVAKIEQLKSAAGGCWALAELTSQLQNEGILKLAKVRERYEAAREAIEQGNATKAIKEQGTGLNLIKGVSPLSKANALKKQAGNWARRFNVTVKEVDLADAEVVRLAREVAEGFNDLNEKLNSLDDEVDRLTEALAEQDPESVNPTASKEYKAKLKECVKNYKTVVDFAKQGMAKAKKLQGDLKKIETIISKTVAGNARAVVPAIEKLAEALETTYSGVDSRIQSTIRLPDSTFSKQAKDWGITTEDRTKSLGPMQDRAFALNYQMKEIVVASKDRLIDMLDDLAKRFACEEARVALARMS